AADVQGQRLNFGVSGMLWQRSLVMYDQETDSLWSHILGTAQSGPLKGTRLQQIPSVMTDWKNWRQQHPQTTVVEMVRTSRDYITRFHTDLREHFVHGISDGVAAKSWSFDKLFNDLIVHDTWEGKPVVVLFDRPSMTPRVFSRQLGKRELQFEVQKTERGNVFRDIETGSMWHPIFGIATEGLLSGQQLEPLSSINSFERAWKDFYPASQNN
ncbi:MAG: DUF3179 domain-containing protein, partial [Planctomycetales bacterium]